jgi:hypothetical protein
MDGSASVLQQPDEVTLGDDLDLPAFTLELLGSTEFFALRLPSREPRQILRVQT